MSRKHPQNGPSFSKATYKTKPLTDEELAQRQAAESAREEAIIEKGRKGREFSARIKAFGSIPLRGPKVNEFWKDTSARKRDE